MKKLAILLALTIVLSGCAPAPVENAAPVKVFFAGESGGVKTALDLAAQAGTVTLVSDMAQADALVLDGVIPPGAVERAQAGAGVVLILGEGVTNEQASALLGQPVTLIPVEDAVSLAGAKGVSDALLTEIVWNGAPQVRERQVLEGLNAGAQTLVSVFESGEGVLHNIAGRTFVLTAAISDQANPQMQEWGYFNYLIYHLAARAADATRFYFWQSLTAPVAAAAAYYLFLSPLAKLIWQGDEITSIALFFIGLVPCMPVFFFFYALAGGWDQAGLDEADEASRMTGFLRPVVNFIFIAPSRWGAKISPLHNRFPITMRPAALAEAKALTEERVKLVSG